MTAQKPCRRADCDYLDFGCHMGHANVADCEFVRALALDVNDSTGQPSDVEMRFPWTGRPFGLNDLRVISACRRPHVIGMVGAENAGKTTMLALLFLMLLRGQRLRDGTGFAGSYTLEGWESISRWMQLRPPLPMQFPPHTPNTAQRQPGMLHLAVSEPSNGRRHILLTDAPGEWFTAWTFDEGAENAEGARWISRHADRFLLIADSCALTGQKAGASRNALNFLARRLAATNGGRETALVWTKADVARPEKLVVEVESMFRQHFAEGPIFSVQVPPKVTGNGLGDMTDLIAVYDWAIEATTIGGVRLVEARGRHRVGSDDPFLSYEGHRYD